MIVSAAVVPALVYGADENIAALFAEFGKHLGILFQLTDDILDVTGDFEKLGKTLGKDASEGKLTSVRVADWINVKNLPNSTATSAGRFWTICPTIAPFCRN